MATETELKMRVADHGAVREKLKSRGAKFIKRQLETNTFLDKPDDELRKSGCGLRVRAAKNLDTGKLDVIITHKGPRKPGPMKIREESELEAGSYDDALRLLGQLGFEVKLSFEKRRETWELGDCEIVLDELPGGLGRYVEIEGENEQCIEEIRHQLSLDNAPVQPESYASIVAEHLPAAGRKQLNFPE